MRNFAKTKIIDYGQRQKFKKRYQLCVRRYN